MTRRRRLAGENVLRGAAVLRLAVLVLAAVSVLLPAGRLPVWDDNEARHMMLARDILQHDRWLMPELREAPYVNKPQLFFWSIAAASLPGGRVTEWTAALPAALSAVATVAGVVAIGTRAWGPTVGRSKTVPARRARPGPGASGRSAAPRACVAGSPPARPGPRS